MANKIKGLTLEIRGETTSLQEALKDVNKQSRDLSSELRQVERGLRFNPKDTELLAQKQKLLGDQVATTRERLDRLKEAEKQVQQQFERGEIKEEQYRAFKREVVETESKLAHYEKQLQAVIREQDSFGKSLQEAGGKLKEVGKKLTEVGKSLSLKVTAPLTGLGAVVAKTGMDFQAAMSEVGAISGATGDDLKALEEMAKEMGATTKFSASEAAEGLKYMAMAGWDTQQQLDGLPGVLSLAAASGEALGTVSDIVTDAMTAFGMEAARAGEFADTLAAAASSSNTNVSMLGESFKNVAPVAGALGYEAKDTAIALGLMANAGIKGGQAGTSMRSILTRLVKPTKESSTAMDQLGISLTDSEGNMKSLEQVMGDLRGAFKDLDPDQQAFYAAQIAGQQGMSGLLAIVNAGEEDFNNLSDAINNSTGEAERMSKEMQDNLQGRLTQLKSAIEGVALQLYDALLPAFEKIVAIVQKAVDWFAELSPGVKQTIVVVAGLAAAIGPVLIVLGAMSSGIGAVISVVGTLSAALPVLGTALTVLTGPIGLVVAAVVGLIAIWVKWGDDIKRIVNEVVTAVTEWFGKFEESITEIWENIKQKTTEIWENMKQFLAEWWPALLAIITGPIGQIVTLISNSWDKIREFTHSTWTAISEGLSRIWDNINEAAARIWQGIMETIKGTINGITEMINKWIRWLNNIKIRVPSITIPFVGTFGGWEVGLPTIPEIPRLAAGGIVTQEMLAVVGERGAEAVIPLDRIDGIIAKALEKANMAGGDTIINVYNPQPSPSELARQIKRAQQDLALGF